MRHPQRYRILALLFAATTINYLDRSIIGVLAPTLRDKVFGWSSLDYSYITIAFQLSYAIGLLSVGTLIDRIGVRKGFTITISVWSVFGALHALIRPAFGLIGFIVARFGLGLGESGNFPCTTKVIAEWFPQRQRGLATGVVNASTNIGAVLAPLIVPLLVSVNGKHWQSAFLITPVFSAVWAVCWWKYYRSPAEHPKVTADELALIQRDTLAQTERPLSWAGVARCRETWAFALLKLPDAVWWFYLFWTGIFLTDKFHLSIATLGLPLVAIFATADLGSILGGWISGRLIGAGWSVNRARKSTLLGCAILVMPVVFVTRVQQSWQAVVLLALAAAAHQAWSTNIFTILSDVFPRKALGSVVGIGGMIGSIGTIVAFFTLGHVIHKENPNSYLGPFIVAGSVYLVVLGFAQRLMPKLQPANLDLIEIPT
ncbi:MAG TPA: MFS transporter [Opitutaceae bacterium]|jgi:ACS family hexuronate transporter-like MFS transporter